MAKNEKAVLDSFEHGLEMLGRWKAKLLNAKADSWNLPLKIVPRIVFVDPETGRMLSNEEVEERLGEKPN